MLLLHNLKNNGEAVRNLKSIRICCSVVNDNGLEIRRAELEQVCMTIRRKLAEPTGVERRLRRTISISGRQNTHQKGPTAAQ